MSGRLGCLLLATALACSESRDELTPRSLEEAEATSDGHPGTPLLAADGHPRPADGLEGGEDDPAEEEAEPAEVAPPVQSDVSPEQEASEIDLVNERIAASQSDSALERDFVHNVFSTAGMLAVVEQGPLSWVHEEDEAGTVWMATSIQVTRGCGIADGAKVQLRVRAHSELGDLQPTAEAPLLIAADATTPDTITARFVLPWTGGLVTLAYPPRTVAMSDVDLEGLCGGKV